MISNFEYSEAGAAEAREAIDESVEFAVGSVTSETQLPPMVVDSWACVVECVTVDGDHITMTFTEDPRKRNQLLGLMQAGISRLMQ